MPVKWYTMLDVRRKIAINIQENFGVFVRNLVAPAVWSPGYACSVKPDEIWKRKMTCWSLSSVMMPILWFKTHYVQTFTHAGDCFKFETWKLKKKLYNIYDHQTFMKFSVDEFVTPYCHHSTITPTNAIYFLSMSNNPTYVSAAIAIIRGSRSRSLQHSLIHSVSPLIHHNVCQVAVNSW